MRTKHTSIQPPPSIHFGGDRPADRELTGVFSYLQPVALSHSPLKPVGLGFIAFRFPHDYPHL